MILTERIAHAVAGGGVTVAYCRWKQSRVKPGATFRTVAGVVRVNTIEPVLIEQLNDADAGRAGYNSPDELTATFRGDPADPIFKIGLSWVAADPREALGNKAHLTPEEVADIDALLDRLDARTPWARATLGRIVQEPGITATALAAELPMGKEPLKRRIRTLKEHGLTHSRRIGYGLSARGYAYLTATSHTTERPQTRHHRQSRAPPRLSTSKHPTAKPPHGSTPHCSAGCSTSRTPPATAMRAPAMARSSLAAVSPQGSVPTLASTHHDQCGQPAL